MTLADGRVLVVGGMSREAKSYSSAYLFDPATGHWTKAGRLRTARHSLTASLLADGRVLVAGGRYSAGADDYEREGAAGATLAAYRVPAADGTPEARRLTISTPARSGTRWPRPSSTIRGPTSGP